MKLSVKQRLSQILEDQKERINATELAKIIGRSKGRISQVMANGAESLFTYSAAQRLHERFGYSIAWVLDGQGDRFAKERPPGPSLLMIDQYRDAAYSAGAGIESDGTERFAHG